MVNVSKRKQLSNITQKFHIYCKGFAKPVFSPVLLSYRNLSKTPGLYNHAQPPLMKTRLQLGFKTLQR